LVFTLAISGTNHSNATELQNMSNTTNTTYKSDIKIISNISTNKTNFNETEVDLKSYLQETKNCEVSDPTIKATVRSLTTRSTSAYKKADRIFNWVRDNINYSFYYNTEHGALGTLENKDGNCCDTTHLLIALSRAAGIPARYIHGDCKFSTGSTFGHVWAQLYVDGKWYDADAISLSNRFGVITNWNKKTAVIHGFYKQLPF
jgi:transglutaminase-like putative cysteine protease